MLWNLLAESCINAMPRLCTLEYSPQQNLKLLETRTHAKHVSSVPIEQRPSLPIVHILPWHHCWARGSWQWEAKTGELLLSEWDPHLSHPHVLNQLPWNSIKPITFYNPSFLIETTQKLVQNSTVSYMSLASEFLINLVVSWQEDLFRSWCHKNDVIIL